MANKRFTNEHKELAKMLYIEEGYTLRDIAHVLDCNSSNIEFWAKDWEVAVDNHKIRFYEHAFDTITNDSAYFLGWLATDGNIRGNRFSLQITDLDVIEKYKRFLSVERKTDVVRRQGVQPQYFLCLTSTIAAKMLKYYGIIERKSLVIKVHEVLATNRHFWRGALEGDGYISWSNNIVNCGLTSGSFEFITQFSNFIEVTIGYKVRLSKDKEIYNIKLSGAKAISLLTFLYNETTESSRMNRKYKYFVAAKGLHENKELRFSKTWTTKDIKELANE